DESMQYLIIGTGGTGGAIGSYLAKAGNDVTFLARESNPSRYVTRGAGASTWSRMRSCASCVSGASWRTWATTWS
ncbi:MAG: hypothetical protein IJJ14_00195, partial [Coriobacteriales bacterium]|nr:hypothetical protein [Coriobacteriales bacterium]